MNDLKERLFTHWHSTLAGVLVALLVVFVALISSGTISATQVANAVNLMDKVITGSVAAIGAIALILSKSGNADLQEVATDMTKAVSVMGEIEQAAGAVTGSTAKVGAAAGNVAEVVKAAEAVEEVGAVINKVKNLL